MRVEINIASKKIALFVVIALVGVLIGYGIALALPNAPKQGGAACLTLADLNQQGKGACLTLADLNRTDLGNAIMLSRFCEGIGFVSAVRWQKDAEGNTYGEPVCLEMQPQ